MIDTIARWFHPRLELHDPVFLLVALAAVFVVLIARRRQSRILYSSLDLLPPGSRSLRERLAWIPTALQVAAVFSLAVALTRPQLPEDSERIRREGIAIMMVVDTSSSMSALDLSRDDEELTRLDAVKKVFREFVSGDADGELRGRPDDSIGLVSFAGFADTRSPLTLDHDLLLKVNRDLELAGSRREDGTALGDGLGLAIERLRRSDAKSRVAILLTDGVQTAGELDPLSAAQLAADLRIKVYTIGAGTTGMADVKVHDPFSGRTVLQRRPVEIDEKTLREVADKTGGAYFRAGDYDGLRRVYGEIDSLERTELEDERYGRANEVFRYPLGAAVLLSLLAFILRATWLRRLPE